MQSSTPSSGGDTEARGDAAPPEAQCLDLGAPVTSHILVSKGPRRERSRPVSGRGEDRTWASVLTTGLGAVISATCGLGAPPWGSHLTHLRPRGSGSRPVSRGSPAPHLPAPPGHTLLPLGPGVPALTPLVTDAPPPPRVPAQLSVCLLPKPARVVVSFSVDFLPPVFKVYNTCRYFLLCFPLCVVCCVSMKADKVALNDGGYCSPGVTEIFTVTLGNE